MSNGIPGKNLNFRRKAMEMTEWLFGFGIFMGLILIVVIIYTIVKVRKQARRAEEREEEKKRGL